MLLGRFLTSVAVIFCTVPFQGEAAGSASVSVSSNGFMSSAGLGAGASALASSQLRLLSSRQEKADHAVVTHICADDWIPGALALGASLKKFAMKADVVVMIHKNVTKPYRELLSSLFDRVYVQEPLLPHPSIKRIGADCVTLQLRSWQLPYKKALYMDSDMVALKSPESLFENNGEITAKIDRWTFGWNGGMFMCLPSDQTFKTLEQALHIYKTPKWAKQGIQQYLNHMFPKCNRSGGDSNALAQGKAKKRGLAGCWGYVMGKEHNKFTRELTPTEVNTLMSDSANGPYSSIHYSGDWAEAVKPWQTGCMAIKDSNTRLNGSARQGVFNLWHRAFDEFKPPASMKTLAQIDCPMWTCAKNRRSLDYVVVAPDIDCSTNAVIKSLVQFAGPRKILVIAPAKACAKFKAPAHHSVECIDQDTVLPNAPWTNVHNWFQKKFGKNNMTDSVPSKDPACDGCMTTKLERMHAMADKYLRQFWKMGIASLAESHHLSEDFVIWDADTVLFRDFCPLNEAGEANLMEDELPDKTCHDEISHTFKQLTGLDYALSDRKNKTFDSHHMVVNVNAMSGLLQTLQKSRPEAADWSLAVLEAACPTLEKCACGFSEFGTYASWMKHQHPSLVAEVPKQLAPARHAYNVKIARDLCPTPPCVKTVFSTTPVCCPDDYHLDFDRHHISGDLAVTFNHAADHPTTESCGLPKVHNNLHTLHTRGKTEAEIGRINGQAHNRQKHSRYVRHANHHAR